MSKNNKLVIYGAGGHGRVIQEAAELSGWEVLGFIDDQEDGLSLNDPTCQEAACIVGIGDNRTRQAIIQKLKAQGIKLANVIHPEAYVSPSAKLEEGIYIGPGAIVHRDVTIGMGCIINSGSIIEHDCKLGEACHIAPGSVLGGGVTVGEGTLVGLGSRVLPCMTIGQWATVGAGSVVLEDLPDKVTAVGSPAQITSSINLA